MAGEQRADSSHRRTTRRSRHSSEADRRGDHRLTERPVVDFDSLSVRPAVKEHGETLESLRCGDSAYAKEVEWFLREKALARHLNPTKDASHRLLVFCAADGRVVGA